MEDFKFFKKKKNSLSYNTNFIIFSMEPFIPYFSQYKNSLILINASYLNNFKVYIPS